MSIVLNQRLDVPDLLRMSARKLAELNNRVLVHEESQRVQKGRKLTAIREPATNLVKRNDGASVRRRQISVVILPLTATAALLKS